MPLWLTALKMVPWDDVIKQTPKLVRQARQLFRSSKADAPAPSAGTDLSPESLDLRDAHAVATLVRDLHQRVQALEKEQRETAALIESLAEQHQMVVQALAALRARAKGLTTIAAVLAVAVALLVTWVARH